jgi:hypothetical protein
MAKKEDLQILVGADLAFALKAGTVPSKSKQGKYRARTRMAKKLFLLKTGGGAYGKGPKRHSKTLAKAIRLRSAVKADDVLVVVVNSDDRLLRDTIRQVVSRAPSVVEARHQKLTDEAVDQLLSVYMPTPPDAAVTQLLLDSNAKARKRFFDYWPCATSKQLAESAGHSSSNPSMTAARWKNARKVFSVKHAGTEYFPFFQFSDGQPIPVVGEVIRKLDEKKSPWQLAFWFTSPNGWLGGRVPAHSLDDREQVLAAAAQEAEFIAG